ncbi:MAG TPA: phosphate ABC transporter permease subunit PstC [Actinomycetota bacterium]|nr:phosphate ABC transporter permease subunit PstC [Actinomycetota bacterium]
MSATPAPTSLREGGDPALSQAVDLSHRPRPGEKVIRALLAACGVMSILTTAGIVLTLAFEAFEFFREVPVWSFVTGTNWSALIEPKAYGVLPLVSGTLMIGVLSAIVGVPLGVSTAIYLREYASPRVRNRLKPTLEVLAGIPTVVLGYFALTFVTETVLRPLFGDRIDFYNGLSAGLVVGIMIVPIIASVSEDAMAAVPRSLREGAFGLGASRMTTSLRVVLPAAMSGIAASVVLGLSRAVGETMIVAIAAGSSPRLTANPLRSIQTLTGYIVQASLGDTPQTSLEYKGVFAVGLVLFLMTLALNVASIRLVRKFRQAY